MKQARKIILGQIRSTKFNTDTYPLHREISNIKLRRVDPIVSTFYGIDGEKRP